MPLQQRVIEPVFVSRSTLPLPAGDIKPLIKSIAAATGQGSAANAAGSANINIVNELECVTNGTLANLIRQLSSLSRQAEELLTGVFDEASGLLTRTVKLQQRMDLMASKIETLDQPSDAPITLRDPTNQREVFSSNMLYDQQILSKQKMPSSIAELYRACDKPPPLNKLDPYRDDGKDGLKFYTDPTFFFELWKKEMMKNQGDTNAEAPKRPSSQSNNTNINLDVVRRNERFPQKASMQHLSSTPQMQGNPYQQHMPQQFQQSQQHVQQPIYQSQTMVTPNLQQFTEQSAYEFNSSISDIQSRVSTMSVGSVATSMPTAQMIRPPPPQQTMMSHSANTDMNYTKTMSEPPPPPPPALSPLPPPALSPPPPPPPPPPQSPPPPLAPPTQPASQAIHQPTPVAQLPTAAQLQQKQRELKKTVPIQRDTRSDLLAAIKQGITLRKVEDSKRRVEAEKQTIAGNDVASILARRVAMQASDSDDSDQGSEDENEWDDSSNR